jgi:sugar transferase (PEP-CTERM/EpsH1 system associated)
MTKRPRLLYLCARHPWPLNRGDRFRAYNLVKAFSAHADVTLVAFTDGMVAEAPIEPLLEHCSRVEVVSLPLWQSRFNMLTAIPGREPFQVAYYRSEVMEKLADRLNRESFDMAFAHLFRMAPYLDRMTRSRRLIDLCDSLAMNLKRAAKIKPLHSRPAFQEEYRRVERYERESLDRAEEGWVITETDRRDFLDRSPRARVSVVPNGIEQRWGAAGLAESTDDSALFLGNLTVGHNVDAAVYLAEQIWPKVRARRPEARLHLVGTPGRTVERLGRLPGVRVEGFVPDLTLLLQRCRMALAPLRYGAGVQNKVLETMAAGLPAVVTSMVNDPIGAEPGREILEGDSADELAGAIVRLFEHPDEARRIGTAGRAFVTSRYSWERASERLREIL